jgi:hypothetical protein
MFARSSMRATTQRSMLHTSAVRNGGASGRLFAASAAAAAGTAMGVWSYVNGSSNNKSNTVAFAADAPATSTAVVVVDDEFRVFRSRVLPLWYRVVVLFFSLISGGLLYPFIAPILHFNHLEECVPTMRVNGRALVWTGEFSAYYTQAMISLGYSVLTLGFYTFLGYTDQRMETYVDQHIKFAK